MSGIEYCFTGLFPRNWPVITPVCTCGLPKAFNSQAPTLDDGRSVPCEMNKFDPMMILLSAMGPDFSQVVAVDAEFVIFSRAWCVAEIVAAHEVGKRQ